MLNSLGSLQDMQALAVRTGYSMFPGHNPVSFFRSVDQPLSTVYKLDAYLNILRSDMPCVKQFI